MGSFLEGSMSEVRGNCICLAAQTAIAPLRPNSAIYGKPREFAASPSKARSR